MELLSNAKPQGTAQRVLCLDIQDCELMPCLQRLHLRVTLGLILSSAGSMRCHQALLLSLILCSQAALLLLKLPS